MLYHFSFVALISKQRISYDTFHDGIVQHETVAKEKVDGLMNIPSLKFWKITVNGHIKRSPSAHLIQRDKEKVLFPIRGSRVVFLFS